MYQHGEGCIHCGKCTSHCPFLKKHNMDLGEYAEAPKLAYHCFLCGQCRRVCPKGIDGRAISLALRRRRVDAGYRPQRDGYSLMLLEKREYLFRNYRHGQSRSVLFPGCNFSAYFPQTTRHLSRMLEERAGIGTVYDCCGKPVSELGLARQASLGLEGMDGRLASRGVEELVVLCPNCYHYLKGQTKMKVRSIYEKLVEWDLAQPTDLSGGRVFVPCPDRDTEELLGFVEQHLLTGTMARVEGIPCCGLGGCAGAKEPQLSGEMQQAFSRLGGRVYTYCATCAGRIAAGGTHAEHLLCGILGCHETPARGLRSLWNRARFRFQ